LGLKHNIKELFFFYYQFLDILEINSLKQRKIQKKLFFLPNLADKPIVTQDIA